MCSSDLEAISDGGVLAGGVVQWDLTGVTAKTVTYKLLPALCAGAFTFGQSTWQAGSVEALVTGESSVSRNPFADQPLGAWQSVDIGYTGGAAQALGEHDVVVDAGGAGVKGKEDQLRFIYISMKGDFELSAQIDCMDDSGALGQAGLMVRDTTDVFSAHALFALSTVDFRKTGIRIFKGAYRRATDPTRSSTLSTITNNREVASLPIWVKLQRAGTKISFFRSSDGINYGDPISERDIGTGNTQVDLKEDALVGLAATGGGGRADVTFRSVSGPSFAGGGTSPSFHRGDSDDNGSLQLTDAVRILNFLFLGTGKITCMDAADVDNNGTVQLTDAVRVLNVLFLGTGSIPDPGPPGESFGNKPCGPDPGDTHIGCETYTHC